jgi:sporulation protein YlmC with PRC-barrel domain
MKIAPLLIRVALLACLVTSAVQSHISSTAATLPDLREHLATHLLGRVVENQDALELGRLKDIIIEPETGKPRYGVISSGGIAGLKPRRRLIPAPALSSATAKRSVLFLEVPSEKWAKAPAFKKSELPNLGKQEVVAQVYGFYGVPTNGPGIDAATSSKPGANQLTRTGADSPMASTPDVNLRLVTGILGENVYDTGGEKLGTITDLLLDFSGANPTMAILSAKSLLKTSECFAVPLSAVKKSDDGKSVVERTRTSLQQATLLNERAWREAANRDAVYRCYAR